MAGLIMRLHTLAWFLAAVFVSWAASSSQALAQTTTDGVRIVKFMVNNQDGPGIVLDFDRAVCPTGSMTAFTGSAAQQSFITSLAMAAFTSRRRLRIVTAMTGQWCIINSLTLSR
jgi:hypothetical protein